MAASGIGKRFVVRLLGGVIFVAVLFSHLSWSITLSSPDDSPQVKAVVNSHSAASVTQSQWEPLAEDGIHDPSGPGIHELQEPGEILSRLPSPEVVRGLGNQVRWVEALESGAISPRRSRILPEPKVPVLDMDVLLDLHGSMRVVRFPHKAHTEWLACENCHDEIFKPRIGANGIAMFNILNGEQCGRCHGAVSFPILRECILCHSVKRPEERETN